jgi:hypothetical protein
MVVIGWQQPHSSRRTAEIRKWQYNKKRERERDLQNEIDEEKKERRTERDKGREKKVEENSRWGGNIDVEGEIEIQEGSNRRRMEKERCQGERGSERLRWRDIFSGVSICQLTAWVHHPNCAQNWAHELSPPPPQTSQRNPGYGLVM